MISADDICKLVLREFDQLPSKGKPLVRSNGISEWTVLAAIVAHTSLEDTEPEFEPQCIALATGVKATPDSVLAKAHGLVVHDMHAEILAKRAFNWYVLSECEKVLAHEDSLILDSNLKLKCGIAFSMYISEAPCGDASMTLTRNLDSSETTQWEKDPSFFPGTKTLRGRAHFHHVGCVRTKPGRSDSQTTLSKSCSDKLLLTQFTSLLSGPVAQVVSMDGFYLSQLIVPESQLYEVDFERAFKTRDMNLWDIDDQSEPPKKRLKSLQLSDIPSATFFQYRATTVPFKFSRTSAAKPCLASIVYTPAFRQHEVLLQGVKMGSKLYNMKGASCICRRNIAEKVMLLKKKQNRSCPSRYLEWKSTNDRKAIKEDVYNVLGGWIPTGTDDFEITNVV